MPLFLKHQGMDHSSVGYWMAPVSYTHLDGYKRQAIVAHAFRDIQLDVARRGGILEAEYLHVCLLYTSRCV